MVLTGYLANCIFLKNLNSYHWKWDNIKNIYAVYLNLKSKKITLSLMCKLIKCIKFNTFNIHIKEH